MKNIVYTLLIILCGASLGIAQPTKAEKKAKETADLKRIANGKSYVFKANMAMPMGSITMPIRGVANPLANFPNAINGGSIQLTSNYDIKLSGDTLTAFLPYYGVTYSAPTNPMESGIKFTSTRFDYTVNEKKNGTIEISFKPLDLDPRAPSDVQKMILTTGSGTSAVLQINLLNRQPISFSGSLEEIVPGKAS